MVVEVVEVEEEHVRVVLDELDASDLVADGSVVLLDIALVSVDCRTVASHFNIN